MRNTPFLISSVCGGLAIGCTAFFCFPACHSNAEEHTDKKAARQAAGIEGGRQMTIQIQSMAFAQGHKIPKKYTGEGADLSPPLAWLGIPDGTKELALICDDPDAPATEPWVHWVIYKISPEAKGLPEGVPRKPRLKDPHGALQGKNSWPEGENLGYRGPKPPPGHGVHHYYFKLYALSAPLDVEPGLTKKALQERISQIILGEGVLMGTYER